MLTSLLARLETTKSKGSQATTRSPEKTVPTNSKVGPEVTAFFGDRGNDNLDGGSGNDSLWGGSDNDSVKGGSGDDMLSGNQGDDKLDGESGNDRLIGGGGIDWMTGGSGDDTFVFAKDFGADTITDFRPGHHSGHDDGLSALRDLIEVDVDGFAAFQDIVDHATQVDQNVVIDFGAGDSLTLQRIQLAKLNADSFTFV